MGKADHMKLCPPAISNAADRELRSLKIEAEAGAGAGRGA
jgi:hypothetical protein